MILGMLNLARNIILMGTFFETRGPSWGPGRERIVVVSLLSDLVTCDVSRVFVSDSLSEEGGSEEEHKKFVGPI